MAPIPLSLQQSWWGVDELDEHTGRPSATTTLCHASPGEGEAAPGDRSFPWSLPRRGLCQTSAAPARSQPLIQTAIPTEAHPPAMLAIDV